MKFNFVSFENAKELVLRIKALIATHTSNTTIHTTSSEKTNWNAVTNKVDKVSGKGLSANDYTTTEKNKLASISPGAEVNVQSDWSVNDTGSDSFIKNKPTAMPASDVPTWAKASIKPSYVWSEIGSKPSTFPPSDHTHNYAGSSSAGGAATSATKLSTARKIGNANFDGTTNITLSQIGAATVEQVSQLQDAVNHITASHAIDGGDLMDSGPAENTYDGGGL